MKRNSPHRPWVMSNTNMNEQQNGDFELPSEDWCGFHEVTVALCYLLEHGLDETVRIKDSASTKTDKDVYAEEIVAWLTGRLSASGWVIERGRHEWTVRELILELRDNIRCQLMRLFINPTPELFDAAVHDQAQCYRLNVDTFLAQGHDESDFTDKLRLVARQTEHGEVCFMLDGSAQNLGKLWANIIEPFCRLLMTGIIYHPDHVSNLTLILLSNDPAEHVLSRCISECLAIGIKPHVGALRYITARLLGVVF